MAIDTFIDVEKELVINTITGCITDQDSFENTRYITNHPDFQPHFKFLVDTRGITENLVTAECIKEIAKIWPFSSMSKRAYVVKRDIEMGNASMHAQGTVDDSNFIKTTKSMDDAMAWLID